MPHLISQLKPKFCILALLMSAVLLFSAQRAVHSQDSVETQPDSSGTYSSESADGLADVEDSADAQETTCQPVQDKDAEPHHSIAHKILLYLPNRLLDLLDILRVRARVGPGVAVGVRATKVVQAYLGSYVSVYAGIPGPRQERSLRSPIGLESHNGVDFSVLEGSFGGGIGPDYSPTEIGATCQLAIVGVDLGVDPLEIVDFVLGIVGIDIQDDDF